MAQKFNWGAALTTLGGGLGDYAEQKRREAAMRMLREQQVADRELARQQELADREAGYVRQDDLNTQSQGMILPESLYLPGGEATMGGLGGMRMKPAIATLRDMYPQQRQSASRVVPAPEQFVLVGPDGQRQVYTAPAGRVPSAVAAFETPDLSPVPMGTDESGLNVFQLQPNYKRPIPAPRVPGGGGANGPKPLDMQRRADALTEAALGPAVEKTTAAGNVYDFSMGGTQARGTDLQEFVLPEARRAFWQAAMDSSAVSDSTGTPRWPIDSPTDVLAGKIWEAVAPQYAEVQLPPGWEFRDKPGTADDRFVGVDMGPGKFDKNKKPLEFFKEYIVPKVNEAGDAGLAWQALVASAKKYGLDLDDLKPLLDKSKFAAVFGMAQDSKIDDEINKVSW